MKTAGTVKLVITVHHTEPVSRIACLISDVQLIRFRTRAFKNQPKDTSSWSFLTLEDLVSTLYWIITFQPRLSSWAAVGTLKDCVTEQLEQRTKRLIPQSLNMHAVTSHKDDNLRTAAEMRNVPSVFRSSKQSRGMRKTHVCIFYTPNTLAWLWPSKHEKPTIHINSELTNALRLPPNVRNDWSPLAGFNS